MRATGQLVAVVLVALAGVAGPMSVPAIGQQSVETDDVVMTVSVSEDGNAHWTIEYRTQLDTQDREDAFASLQTDIRKNTSTYTESFRPGIEDLAADAENETGREMAVEDLSVSTEVESIPQDYGVVTYTFTWKNFAAANGSSVQIGDSISRLYLNANTTLVIEVPDDYEVDDVSPAPSSERESAVVWKGEMQFASDEPRISVSEPDDENQNDDPQTGGPTDPQGPNDDERGLPVVPIAGGLLAVGVVGGVAYHRGLIDFGDGDAPLDAVDTSDSAPDESVPSADDEGDDEVEDADADHDDDEDDGIDEELLSNEEKVMRKMREHDGRMKQKELVKELGWSDAKTSRVVSDLRDAGEIDGFRLGRENVLELPDDEDEDSDEE